MMKADNCCCIIGTTNLFFIVSWSNSLSFI